MNFTFNGQKEIVIENQGIYIYSFSFSHHYESPNKLINEFLHSNEFKENCLSNKQKLEKNEFPYLSIPFNDHLMLSDFKPLNRTELLQFFQDYSNSDSWRDDKKDFVSILNKFNELIIDEITNDYFLISKEWFNKGNKILNDSSEIYIYYFLIIWINLNKSILTICMWSYD